MKFHTQDKYCGQGFIITLSTMGEEVACRIAFDENPGEDVTSTVIKYSDLYITGSENGYTISYTPTDRNPMGTARTYGNKPLRTLEDIAKAIKTMLNRSGWSLVGLERLADEEPAALETATEATGSHTEATQAAAYVDPYPEYVHAVEAAPERAAYRLTNDPDRGCLLTFTDPPGGRAWRLPNENWGPFLDRMAAAGKTLIPDRDPGDPHDITPPW